MKKLSLIVFGMFIISMGLSFVSAAPANDFVNGVQEAGETVFQIIRPILESVIGETVNGETFLAKLLLLMIIFAVVFKAISKIDLFSGNDWVLWGVSIAVSVLSIRWFGSAEFVNTVILPYSVLGLAISAGIPFILAFVIIEDLRKTMRRFAWLFFIVIFVGLWFSRYDDLGKFGYIYLVTAGLAIVMMFMDGTIQRWKSKMSIDRSTSYINRQQIDKLEDELRQMSKRFADGGYPNKAGVAKYTRDTKKVKDMIATLAGN